MVKKAQVLKNIEAGLGLDLPELPRDKKPTNDIEFGAFLPQENKEEMELNKSNNKIAYEIAKSKYTQFADLFPDVKLDKFNPSWTTQQINHQYETNKRIVDIQNKGNDSEFMKLILTHVGDVVENIVSSLIADSTGFSKALSNSKGIDLILKQLNIDYFATVGYVSPEKKLLTSVLYILFQNILTNFGKKQLLQKVDVKKEIKNEIVDDKEKDEKYKDL